MIRRLALLLLCGLCALELSAEERPYELGLALHSSYYLGELDPRGLLGRHRPGLSLSMSYQPQLHWSWTGELGLRQLSAHRVDEALARLGAQEDFSRRLVELRLGGRYYFLPLSREQSYLRTRPWSPYLGLGLGLALGGRSSTSRELLLPSLYLGLGVKALRPPRGYGPCLGRLPTRSRRPTRHQGTGQLRRLEHSPSLAPREGALHGL